jgi:hypothetical protein
VGIEPETSACEGNQSEYHRQRTPSPRPKRQTLPKTNQRRMTTHRHRRCLHQMPKLKVSPTGTSNLTTWCNHLIPLVRSYGVAAHFDGEFRPASHEQADLDRHAKEQSSAIVALISSIGDTRLNSVLADLIRQPFNQLPHVLFAAVVICVTQNYDTAHNLLLDGQRAAMIQANEPPLVYSARHLATSARLVEASAPNTSISSTIKARYRGMSCSGQHAFVYTQL